MNITPRCRFAIAEESVLRDQRLTHAVKQVYVTLKLFHKQRQGQCWPKRKEVAAVVGCTINFVSYATERLAELGYLEKRRNRRGRSKSASYRFPRVENATLLTGVAAAKAFQPHGVKEQPKIQCARPITHPPALRRIRLLSACQSQLGPQCYVCIPDARTPLRAHVWQRQTEGHAAQPNKGQE